MSNPSLITCQAADKIAAAVRTDQTIVRSTRHRTKVLGFRNHHLAVEVAARCADLFTNESGAQVSTRAIQTGCKDVWSSILVEAVFDTRRKHQGDLLLDDSDRPYGAACFSDCSFRVTSGAPVVVPLARPVHRFRTWLGSQYYVFADGTCSRQKYDLTGRYTLMAQVFFITPEAMAAMREARTTQLVLSGTFPAEREPRVGLHPLEYGRIHAEGEPGPLATWADGQVTFPRVNSCWHHTGDVISEIA